MYEQLKTVFRWKELIRNMVLRNLRIRYKGSVLGFFWTMINPFFMMLIYFIFITLLKIKIDLPRLLVGILSWQFFVMCLSDSVNSITGYPSLIKRTYFPKLVFPLSMVLANLVNFLLSLIVLAAFLIIYSLALHHPINIGPSLLLLPLIILLQTALILGLANFFSCCNVYFKDIEHIMSILLLAWFFLTPVMYPLEMVQTNEQVRPWMLNLYFLNPMVPVVTCYRHVFLGTPLPAGIFFRLSIIISPLILYGGTALFLKKEPYFTDEM